MNEHHHRRRYGRSERRRPDIKRKTLFAHRGAWYAHKRRFRLHARRAKLRRISHAAPSRLRLRLPPTEIAYRRRGIGNALENERPHGGNFAFEFSLGDANVRRGKLPA